MLFLSIFIWISALCTTHLYVQHILYDINGIFSDFAPLTHMFGLFKYRSELRLSTISKFLRILSLALHFEGEFTVLWNSSCNRKEKMIFQVFLISN